MTATTTAPLPTRDHPRRLPPTRWRTVTLLALGIGLLVTAALTAFAWPATNAGASDLELALVAPPDSVAPLTGALDQAAPGAFEVSTPATEAEARAQVADGSADGAIVLAPGGAVEVVVASEASSAAAQAFINGADAIAAQQASAAGMDIAPPATVTDVAPTPPGDPRGAAVPSAMLPLFIAGMVTGGVALLVVRGTARRTALALAAPAVAGLGAALVLQTWLDALGGSFLAQWAALSLGASAIALFLVGAVSLLGRSGITLVTLVMLLLGNPLSAAATGPAFLPDGWAALGQWLPPGATATVLREIAAYGSAGASVWILAGWVTAGLLMIAAGARMRGHDPLSTEPAARA